MGPRRRKWKKHTCATRLKCSCIDKNVPFGIRIMSVKFLGEEPPKFTKKWAWLDILRAKWQNTKIVIYSKVIKIPKSNLNSKFGTPRRLRVWSRIANGDVTWPRRRPSWKFMKRYNFAKYGPIRMKFGMQTHLTLTFRIASVRHLQIWCKNVDRRRNYGPKSKSNMAAVRNYGPASPRSFHTPTLNTLGSFVFELCCG